MCKENGAGSLCLLDANQKYFAQLACRKLPRTYLLDAQGKILRLDLEYLRATGYDLRNALHTSASLRFDAPITAHLAALYADAAEHGLADLDQSALFQELQRRQEQA